MTRPTHDEAEESPLARQMREGTPKPLDVFSDTDMRIKQLEEDNNRLLTFVKHIATNSDGWAQHSARQLLIDMGKLEPDRAIGG